MKILLYLLLSLLCVTSCTPTENPPPRIQEDPSTVTITNESLEKKIFPEKLTILNLDVILENFLKEVREVPAVKITDSILLDKKVPYLEFFPKENISKITLYTNEQAKQKKNLPYVDLFLVSLEYNSDSSAVQAFQIIKNEIKFLIAPAARGSLDNEKQYKTSRYITPYHGGFLLRKGNRILSLGKKCGGNQLKLNFRDYEKLFLKRLEHQKEDSEIIKADCGDVQFKILTTYR